MKKQRASSSILSENSEPHVASFVVRIWKEPGPAESEYRGWVEHVQSGQRTAFLGLEQMAAAIARYVQALPQGKAFPPPG